MKEEEDGEEGRRVGENRRTSLSFGGRTEECDLRFLADVSSRLRQKHQCELTAKLLREFLMSRSGENGETEGEELGEEMLHSLLETLRESPEELVRRLFRELGPCSALLRMESRSLGYLEEDRVMGLSSRLHALPLSGDGEECHKVWARISLSPSHYFLAFLLVLI